LHENVNPDTQRVIEKNKTGRFTNQSQFAIGTKVGKLPRERDEVQKWTLKDGHLTYKKNAAT
jgi:hypothetical protein